ncbi:hypothetical protein JVT61DRAFT_12069 [Boletus reticuloceps]|uniref:Uncharacterized protein n=1 Tax=Boletus reticuloceps TaxID=495285 RepID=A0A8I2YEF1_9AGAM|nr:hypothetical protein JVT61DRAFT_12069 [Boletus reticuloceps]
MAPRKWTTNEQEEFLQPWYKKYKELGYMKRREYTKFYTDLFEAWFKRFPESAVLFGEDASRPLSEKQKEKLNAATEECKEKLKNRFKNCLGSTKAGCQSKASANVVFKTVLASMAEGEKHGCSLQETEAYSKLFYGERLKESIAQKLGVASSDLGKQDIQRIKEETCALYAGESEEVKQQVRAFIQSLKDEQGKKGKSCVASNGQKDITRNIDMLPAVVTKFMNGLSKSTGWAFSLLARGPLPDDESNTDCYRREIQRDLL